VATVDRQQRDIDTQLAQALAEPVVRNGVSSVVDRHPPSLEDEPEKSIEATGHLSSKRVRVGGVDAVHGRHGVDRDLADRRRTVGPHSDDALTRDAKSDHHVDDRLGHDYPCAWRARAKLGHRVLVEVVEVRVRARDDVESTRGARWKARRDTALRMWGEKGIDQDAG